MIYENDKKININLWGLFTISFVIFLSLAIFIFNNIIKEHPLFFTILISGYWITVLSSWIAFGSMGSIIFLSIAFLSYILLIPQASNIYVQIYLSGIILFWFIIAWYINRYNKTFSSKNFQLEKLSDELNELINENTSIIKKNKTLQHKIDNFSRLSKVIRELSFSLSIDEVLDNVTTQIFQMIEKGDVCSLYMINENMKSLDFKRYMLRNTHKSILLTPKSNDIFNQWVLQHRQPLIVNDVENDFRFDKESVKNTTFPWVKSLISAPLITGNKLIGIARVDSTEKEEFSIDDLRLLMILANISALIIQNANLYKKTEDLAVHDDLTGLFVPRIFHEKLKELIRSRERENSNKKFSLIMADMDHFKQLNDEYGHVIGDLILKKISNIIKQTIDKEDIPARYGGEEFAIIMPEKDHKQSYELAEKIRKTVEMKHLTVRRKIIKLTLSIGIATYPDDAREVDKLIKIADERLYKAKEMGRNKVL